MAQINLEGLDELNAMFSNLMTVPWDVTKDALDAMAKVAEAEIKRSGETMGVRDPESNVHILDKITHSKPKKTADGGYTTVRFSGTRARGRNGKRTSNSLIAFENEYGNRGQEPRPFVRTAAEQGADAIAAPGEKIVGDWFETAASK